MKIVTGEEMAAIDREAIEQRGIPGLFLMENAGNAVYNVLLSSVPNLKPGETIILCGKGNNGGDGFVAGRLCQEAGLEPVVFLCGKTADLTNDPQVQYEKYKKIGGRVIELQKGEEFFPLKESLKTSKVIIDALLGTGFRGEVRGLIGEIISFIKDFKGWIIAVDIPSGVNADTGDAGSVVISADITVTMGLPKLGLVVPPGYDHVGKLEVAEIGFPKDVLPEDGDHPTWITPEEVGRYLPRRRENSRHKGSNGRILLVAGSTGFTGAAAMAAESAARVGGGLVTVAVPKSLNPILEVKLTEPMTIPLPETSEGTLCPDALDMLLDSASKSDVVAVGPGLGQNKEVTELLKQFLPKLNVPLVLDADGINNLKNKPDWLKDIKTEVVATPHPGELARLWGTDITAVQSDRLGIAKKVSKELGWTVVLKGARSVIADKTGCLWINSSGNPGMATGGSGDILTGIIAGFIGQGISPAEAAVLGVYLHGYAADRVINGRYNYPLVMPMEICRELPAAISQLWKYAYKL